MKAVSKYQPLTHYRWGNNCDGWNLVEEASLSVKQEKIPPGAGELMHLHQHVQQFFFILSGVATFIIDEETISIKAGEGLHIPANTKHKIYNPGTEDLELLLCSQPSVHHDRINCETA